MSIFGQILLVVYQLFVILCCCRVLAAMLFIKLDIRYWGHDFVGIQNIVNTFALKPKKLTVVLGAIKPPMLIMPALGFYDPSTCTITIDTRIVRSKWVLMRTLLHEICHHNQNIQGRLALTTEKCNIFTYWFKAEEIEARGFARAWRFIALKIYKRKIL